MGTYIPCNSSISNNNNSTATIVREDAMVDLAQEVFTKPTGFRALGFRV